MTETDYRFNLDVVEYGILGHPTLANTIPYQPMLKCILLTVQEQIFLRRGMFTKLGKVIRTIDKLREKHGGVVFLRLSSISAKDKKIDWVNTSTIDILRTFISSWRIQEDLDEALARGASVSLCVLPWKTFVREYRTFVTENSCWTRDDAGNLISRSEDSRFAEWAQVLAQRIAYPFVFDMGDSLEYGLTFIECNQFDDTCDLYLPETNLPIVPIVPHT